MAVTPEGSVKAAVKAVLKRFQLWFYMPVQNGMGVVGIPDIIGCQPYTIKPEDVGRTVGLFVAIECKAPGKLANVSANQERQLNGIRAAGGIAVVVDGAIKVEELLDEKRNGRSGDTW